VSQLLPRGPTLVQRAVKLLGCLCRYHTGECFNPPALGFWDFLTDCLQLRSAWEPVQSACIVLNPERSKKAVIAGLVTDVVLLLTMLDGLLRMRLHGTIFGLGQLLWNQVDDASPLPLRWLICSRERV
jgi:hypothetical protein